MRSVVGLLVAAILGACSAATPPPAAPQATPLVPTQAPVAGTGVVTFGTSYDPDDLSIPDPRTRFKSTYSPIAWSASLIEPAGATSLTFVIASQSATGVERIIIKEDVDVSDPAFDVMANQADLALVVGRVSGTYVVRYLRGSTVLAEGTFTLVK